MNCKKRIYFLVLVLLCFPGFGLLSVRAQDLSIRNNLLYDASGTPNLG